MSPSDAGRRAIPHWAASGKRAVSLGFGIVAVCAFASWGFQASDHFLDTSIRDTWVIWIFRVPLGAGLALLVVGGLVWLAGEFSTGFKTPKGS